MRASSTTKHPPPRRQRRAVPAAAPRVDAVHALFALLLAPLLVVLTPLASRLVACGGLGGKRENKYVAKNGCTPRHGYREVRTSMMLLLVLSRHAPAATAMRTGEQRSCNCKLDVASANPGFCFSPFFLHRAQSGQTKIESQSRA